MNSRPASSASTLIAAMSSQLQGHRSGARLMVSPPSQLALNTPSLNRFGPNSGLLARDACMFPSPAAQPACIVGASSKGEHPMAKPLVVITGATHGIGKALADAFAAE